MPEISGFEGVLGGHVALFDKRIDVTLYRDDGTFVEIKTPDTGRKPTIQISGTMVANDNIQQAEVRITNFVTDLPLSEYKTIAVRAGYAGMMQAALQGEIILSYQETPGPDGVTVFQVLTATFSDWTTKTVTADYAAGSLLFTVMNAIAQAVGMTSLYYADTSLALQVDIFFNGLAKDLVRKVLWLFPALTVKPDGATLVTFPSNAGTGIVWRIDYVSSAKRNAAGFDIQAPWVPALRPGDTVEIDAKYFRQEIGAPGTTLNPTAAGNRFIVRVIDIQFCTTDDTNLMTLSSTQDQGAA